MFSMEIDLEVPSKEQEKLIPGSDENSDVLDAAEEIDEEDNMELLQAVSMLWKPVNQI